MNEKYLIISDIHGSFSSLEKVLNYYTKERFNKLFILGDIYYSGARNIPPIDYNPPKVVELLNKVSKEIIAIKGNCESSVDLLVSKFPIFEIYSTFLFDKRVSFYHGHQSYKEDLSKNNDIVFSGHTHISLLSKEGKNIYANPGSISLPKDNNQSFIIFQKNKLSVIDLSSFKEIKSLSLN